MANSFAYAEQYKPLLDEIYKKNSVTSILDSQNISVDNGNTVKIFKTSMNGLGTYSRANGFVNGDVTGTWESITLTQDRGRSFQVDVMDNEETLGMAFGTLVGEFMRTQVAPEIDAYTFAKIAGTSNILAGTPADITVGTTNLPVLIDEAELAMNEKEVPTEGRILFISETAYAGLRAKVTRETMNGDGNVNNQILMYNDMRVVRVPQGRFYTKITLRDGSTAGQTDGGYIGTASTGYKINFMIVHPSAIWKCVKHVTPRIFAPDVNQSADAYKFQLREYHDAGVYANKLHGIYLHRGSTALS